MKKLSPSRNRFKITHPRLLVSTIVVLLVVGAVIYESNRPAKLVTPEVAGPSVGPSPGTPGNPGDEAKSQINAQSTLTPTPAVSSVVITAFTAAASNGDQVNVSTQVTGTPNGTCSLTLTSPSQAKHQASGQVMWSGTYYFCSFGTISGISENGTWNTSLTVTSGSGQTAKAVSTTFKVGN